MISKIVSLLVLSLWSANGLATSKTVFEFSYVNTVDEDRLCESIGLLSVGPGASTGFPISVQGRSQVTQGLNGKFFVEGNCFRLVPPSKKRFLTPVLFRFNADSSLDTTYKPIAYVSYRNPATHCRHRGGRVQDGSGNLFWIMFCNTGKFPLLSEETSILKLNSDGEYDLKFGVRGQLPAPGNELPLMDWIFNGLGLLPDGTLFQTFCYSMSKECVVYNINPNTGMILNQSTYPLSETKRPGRGRPGYLLRPYQVLADGLLIDRMVPLCNGSDCYNYDIPGMSFGINTFQDFVNRKPVLVPQVTSSKSFGLRGPFIFDDRIIFQVIPFSSLANKLDRLEFIKYSVVNGKYVADQSMPDKVKAHVIESFSPEISFNPPTAGEVSPIVHAIEMSKSSTPQFVGSQPGNYVDCHGSVPIADKKLMVSCKEFDAADKYLGATIVRLNKDLSIDTSYADQGYLRIPMVSQCNFIEIGYGHVAVREYPGITKCMGDMDTLRVSFYKN